MTDQQPSSKEANRYMAYSEVFGRVTTEEHCPSLLGTMLNPSGDDAPQPCMQDDSRNHQGLCQMKPRYKHILNIMYFFCWMTQIWFMILILCFCAPGSNDRGIFFLSCLFVCLYVCLSVVNFNLAITFEP